MNLIKKLKRIISKKKEAKAKEELRQQMNAPCNCKYCKQKEQMLGKYSNMNTTKNQ